MPPAPLHGADRALTDRRRNGIEVEDATWQKLEALAAGYGIDLD